MKTKEVIIGDKKFQLKELTYLEVIDLSSIKERKDHALKLFELSGVSKDDAEKLSKEDGMSLIAEINSLNGDFRMTSSEVKDSKTY